ncbi:MAG: hypothetical protein C5B52_08480 [Bacteroidetes bacterium]|nr:MAG: hypothetical protein C5B52_08480 [Bacteroidota bacterium]
MHKLIEWDQWLFGLLNREWTNSFFDKIFPIFRNQTTWYPLYGLLLILAIFWLRKDAIWFAICYILSVVISDQVGMIFKNGFGRLRPCRQTVIPFRQIVEYCPSSYSFISNHASNHFAMAAFVFFALPKLNVWIRVLFLFWAAMICYAQVYVGVHYPADVFAGGCVGFLIGWAMSKLYFFLVNKFNLNKSSAKIS